MASGDIIFYNVEIMLIALSKKGRSQAYIDRAVNYCNGELNAIEEDKCGCQTYIDEYREQLKQYI